jgi:enediyne biosynthesis protein E4
MMNGLRRNNAKPEPPRLVSYKNYLIIFCCTFLAMLHVCCNNRAVKPDANALFTLMDNTGINFTNTITNTKDFNIFSYRNFYNGGGAAIGDINNDGLADVFFTANMGSNKLYVNKGNWQFDDVSEKAGITETNKWSTGVVMVDINNDGWLDIYVCNAGFQKNMPQENALFINNHDLTFTDKAKEYGLADAGYTTHAAFFDYDLDGDLDCYILNNSFIPVNTLNYSNKRELRAEDWPVADFLKGGGDHLMRNDAGKFTDVSKEAGIYGSLIGFGLGVTVGDVNNDGYPDIYVSNDFFERDYLYINKKNGTFTEELEQRMQHISHSSMGADMADVNNDGYPDIFVTEMLPGDDYRLKTTTAFESVDIQRLKVKSGFYNQFMQNTLQINNQNGEFVETAFYSGVAATDWSWGGLIFDADNDGQNDLYVCNGISNDVTDQDFIDFFANDVVQKMVMTGEKEEIENIIQKMPSQKIANRVFRNKGALQFEDIGKVWGFNEPSFSNGAAYGDLDNDGDLDLVVNNLNQPSFIYKNNSREKNNNNYIGITLKGTVTNTMAIGSMVKIYAGNQIINRELIPTRGFQSSVDYKVMVGLGKQLVDSVVIIWPNKTYTSLSQPAINKVHSVTQQATDKPYYFKTALPTALLTPVTSSFDKHTEDDFIDSYYDRNIPMMISHEGPATAVADVNKDGLDDIFIGGASRQAAQLYLQTNNGFAKKTTPAFDANAIAEDVAAGFFDCDGDGDADLLTGSGGNNRDSGSVELQNHLYHNDGKGNFTEAVGSLPHTTANTSIIAPNDFDGDGDIDVFIGSRSFPLNYGPTPPSFIWVNDGKGNFSALNANNYAALHAVGLVTSATWADINGDTIKELIVVGEWMAPQIFTYKNNQFIPLTTGLENLMGWWQSVSAADLDGDGDTDFVLGNIGENTYLQPNTTNPVKMWMNDFDGNGAPEKIITRTIEGQDVPVFLKRDLTDQVVSLKKQNLKHIDFAKKSIQQLFDANAMKNVQVKTFNYNSSCIAINNGKGGFTVNPLPVMVQLSSINAISVTDINNDGKPDIVAGGNKLSWLPQFCRLDASLGHVLINKGTNNFERLPNQQSGLQLRGEIKHIELVKRLKSKALLVVRNNELPMLYQLQVKK